MSKDTFCQLPCPGIALRFEKQEVKCNFLPQISTDLWVCVCQTSTVQESCFGINYGRAVETHLTLSTSSYGAQMGKRNRRGWGITNPPGGVLLRGAEKMGEILASCLRVIENWNPNFWINHYLKVFLRVSFFLFEGEIETESSSDPVIGQMLPDLNSRCVDTKLEGFDSSF